MDFIVKDIVKKEITKNPALAKLENQNTLIKMIWVKYSPKIKASSILRLQSEFKKNL